MSVLENTEKKREVLAFVLENDSLVKDWVAARRSISADEDLSYYLSRSDDPRAVEFRRSVRAIRSSILEKFADLTNGDATAIWLECVPIILDRYGIKITD